jgi:hypothetical protein
MIVRRPTNRYSFTNEDLLQLIAKAYSVAACPCYPDYTTPEECLFMFLAENDIAEVESKIETSD